VSSKLDKHGCNIQGRKEKEKNAGITIIGNIEVTPSGRL
jgi:hypothetical protein